MHTYDGAIIGGGAAGMMTAITAANNGKKVVLVEHKERVGNKILQTGNGKCNFTNYDMDIYHFQNDNPAFVETVLKKFNQQDTLHFFRKIGIYHKERNGYVYPHSETAASVLDALRCELEHAGVDVLTATQVKSIQTQEHAFCVQVEQNGRKDILTAKKVVLATGSKAAPKSGSDGSGYDLAKAMGHKIRKVLPALVQLTAENKCCKAISGVRSTGEVCIYADGNFLTKDKGEIQYTEYGISGIPVFQVSRYAVKALDEKKEITAVVDFVPDMTYEELLQDVEYNRTEENYKDIVTYFSGLLNKKLVLALAKESGLDVTKTVAQTEKKKMKRFLQQLKGYTFWITGSRGFDYAQVCQGGVSLAQVSPDTMQSKKCPGLYFAGEILDVDGQCGGYNLQWAWASGYVAGNEI